MDERFLKYLERKLKHTPYILQGKEVRPAKSQDEFIAFLKENDLLLHASYVRGDHLYTYFLPQPIPYKREVLFSFETRVEGEEDHGFFLLSKTYDEAMKKHRRLERLLRNPLSSELQKETPPPPPSREGVPLIPEGEILPLAELKQRAVFDALRKCRYNRTHAARALGVSLRLVRGIANAKRKRVSGEG